MHGDHLYYRNIKFPILVVLRTTVAKEYVMYDT